MRNKANHERRNKLIYQYYCTRWGDGFRDEVIIAELHNQYHLQPKTIEDIIRAMRKKSQEIEEELTAKQLEMFENEGGENADKEI